jgi:hypothetical protein
MELGRGVDELLPDAAPFGGRVERVGDAVPDHVTVDLLHQIKRRADHRIVAAEEDRTRGAHAGSVERLQNRVLALHVVRRRQVRRPGGPAEHPLVGSSANVEGLVRVSGLMPLDRDLAVTRQRLGHVARERGGFDERR